MENRTFRILIVDDNLKNLQITGKVLRDEGYQISVASSGANALLQVKGFDPDLILLDIMMPEMDGFEVMEKLKADEYSARIPVIFLTARNQTEDLAMAFKSGGVDFVNKPFVKEELLARVGTHVELYESRRRILDMNRTRDKLYSVIAHDIRSPFSAIIQTLELLTEDNELGQQEFKVLLGMLYERSQRTYELLTNLLDWTKIKSGKISITKRKLRLADIIVYNLLLTSQAAEVKQIKVESTVSDSFIVFVDENSINAIIRNLISNAIKFTQHAGNIEISAFIEDDKATIRISDSGIGMSETDIKKIFFEDKHLTTYGTDNESGSGLGLFLVKDLVSLNSGSIRAESIPKSGTSFFVSFPIE